MRRKLRECTNDRTTVEGDPEPGKAARTDWHKGWRVPEMVSLGEKKNETNYLEI